jgi:hypothetical protein
MRINRAKWIGIGVASCLVLSAGALAQEHPSEHPKSAEHPKGHSAGVSKEELGTAIEAYIAGETAKGGGAWKIEDAEEKTTLMLTLDHVHKDKLTSTAKDTYFACADLKNADGHMYDLDVFMKGPDKDHLKVTEVSVHKKDGTERYTWKQKDGLWKKEPVKKS